jgi:hypothetical protein
MLGRRADSKRVAGRQFRTWTAVAAVAALLAVAGALRLLAPPPRKVGAAGATAQTSDRPPSSPSHAAASPADAAPARRSPREADHAPGLDRAVAAIRKRNLLVLAHEEQLLEHADEQAFDAVQMPGRLRVAVRNLNDDWAQERRALLGDQVAGRTPAAEVAAADSANAALDRTRREELMRLLGASDFAAFGVAETAALDRVRERYPGWAGRVGNAAGPAFDLAAR